MTPAASTSNASNSVHDELIIFCMYNDAPMTPEYIVLLFEDNDTLRKPATNWSLEIGQDNHATVPPSMITPMPMIASFSVTQFVFMNESVLIMMTVVINDHE